jgi:hypothetical protein
MELSYYEILGVSSEGATEEDVERAYRKMSKLYHPDSSDGLVSEDMFKAATKARAALLKELRQRDANQREQTATSPPTNSERPTPRPPTGGAGPTKGQPIWNQWPGPSTTKSPAHPKAAPRWWETRNRPLLFVVIATYVIGRVLGSAHLALVADSSGIVIDSASWLLVTFLVIPPALAERGEAFVRRLVATLHGRRPTKSTNAPSPMATKK